MDRDKWITGLLKAQAIDRQMNADDIIQFTSETMTPNHHNEAKYQDRGGQRSWVQIDVRQTKEDIAESSTSTK